MHVYSEDSPRVLLHSIRDLEPRKMWQLQKSKPHPVIHKQVSSGYWIQLRWQPETEAAHRFYQGAHSKCFRLGRPRLHPSRLCPRVQSCYRAPITHTQSWPALGPGRNRKAGQMPHLTVTRPLLPTTHNGGCSSDWFPSISRTAGDLPGWENPV